MRIVAVVQARMGSTRLPGKVMRALGARPALHWAVAAAQRAAKNVVVATSTNPENDTIEKWCLDNGIQCIRGSEDDVLDRYKLVVKETEADAIVRITGDCPLIDANVIKQVIALYKTTPGCMYASNVDPPTWPDGLDCEVISAAVINEVSRAATRHSDRDTVTRYIARNRHRYSSATLTCPIREMHNERWVLDSPEDYAFLQAIVAEFPANWEPNYLDVIDLLSRKPEIRALLGLHWRNQRFFEALAEEGDRKTDFTHSNFLLARSSKVIPFAAQTFSKSHLQFPKEAPLFMSHGSGGYAFDVDGNDYVDLVSALLPNVLGYCDPDVDYSIREQLNSGISMSLSTELEVKLAEKLVRLIPCAEMVKFGKNGSDVTTAAVRVARSFTDRDWVFVLRNGYHGWHDWAVAYTDRSHHAGLGTNFVKRVSDDLNWIEHELTKGPGVSNVAAIVLEPEGRSKGYLQKLRDICTKAGTLLIFDEVITGFRWDLGGYQKYIGVTPDLATFGKAMGNGMPISAVVGRKDIMLRFQPPDNVFYSGTFFGETLSIAAALATIEKMERDNVIHHLWRIGHAIKTKAQLAISGQHLGPLIGIGGDDCMSRLYFRGDDGITAGEVAGLFRKYMIQSGTLIIASNNVCYAHGAAEVERAARSYEYTMQRIAEDIIDGAAKREAVSLGVRA